MDIEEIENQYRLNLEEVERNFLKKLSEGKSSPALENEFRNSLHNIRERYYQNMFEHLEEQKVLTRKPKTQKKEKEEHKVFTVVPAKMKLSLWERTKFRADSFWFKTKIRAKKVFRAVTPFFLIYFYFNVKIKLKKWKAKIADSITQTKQGIANSYQKTLEGIQKATKYVSTKFSEITKKIWGKIKGIFKKKSAEGETNKEGKKEPAPNSNQSKE